MAVASGPQALTEAKKTCNEPDDETDKECKDLRAQQDMAKWARLMYIVTAAGVVVSGLVAVLVLLTFQQTRRTADAAESAVAASRRSSEKQLRAYVSHDSEGLTQLYERDDAWYRSEFFIRNTGQTPAHAVRVWAKLEALPRNLPKSYSFEEPPPNDDGFGNRFVVSPGSRHTQSMTFHAPSSQVDLDLAQGLQALYQWGEIRYNDGFTDDRRTSFRLRLLLWDKPNGEQVGIWTYCDDGNDAT